MTDDRTTADGNETTTVVLDHDGWRDLVDQAARFHLNMTGADFMEHLANGEFDDPDAGPAGLMAVLALVPGH